MVTPTKRKNLQHKSRPSPPKRQSVADAAVFNVGSNVLEIYNIERNNNNEPNDVRK
jgi:hypothetical protein